METPLQTKRVNALFIFLKTMLLLLEQMTIKFFSSSMKTKLSFIPIRNDKDSEIQTNSTRNFFSIALLLLSLFFVGNSFGQANGDYQTRNNGSWGSSSTWSKRVSGSWVNATDYPGQNSGAGVVTILDNDDVTLNVSPSNAISSLVMGGGSNDTNLNFNPSTTLNVTNAVTINAGTSNSRDKIIAVGSGTLNCGSMSFATTTDSSRDVEVTISTGIVTVSGNIVMNGASDRNAIRFSGSGFLRVGSAISGGSVVASTGTVEYYGNGSGGTTSNQTIANYAYNNLETSGSGTKTLAGNTTANGVLTVRAGTTLALSTFALGSPDSIVLENGGTASTISGTGLLTLGGNVTVNKISGSGFGALISCPVALTNASTRTFTVANETTTATDLTVSGIISTTGAIIKAGLGNMVQSGNNTYSGGTTVNAGILSINSTTALGAVANDFTIASGAVANVAANVTVGDLTLGGVGTANGTWGFTGSGATYINTTYFTSTSRVTVSNNTRTNPTVSPTIGSYTYNGSSQGPNTATNTGTGTSYTFSYSGSGYGPTATRPTNAGNYTVTATVGATADGFYNSVSSSPTAFTITKANSTITATGLTSFVYNGSVQGPTTSTKTGSTGTVTYSYSGVNPTVYSASTTRPIAVGTYQVIATLASDSNYNGAVSTAYAFDITPGAFAKLQILLPGETAAPGTGSGKTGTPTSQVSGVAFTVTVNAVDAFWNVVSDAPANTIAITTSDINDSHPANNNLSSGTRTFSITLKTVGSSTVTATNVTNGGITANTSLSVTVTPGIKTTNGDGNWNNPNIWSPVGVPYFSDQVYIISSHDVTVTANATCASINFTNENSSLSVNSGITLTVTGTMTLDSYNDDIDTSAEILGSGTLNAGSLNVGLASVLSNNDSSDNTLNITIATLNVTGDITIYNNDEGGGDANRPSLYINSPCNLSANKLALIQTGNGSGGSRIITFDVDNGATVNLSAGLNPITISSEVDLDDDHVHFDFDTSSTINFNGTVTQNIPASISNSRIGGSTDSSVPVNYGNLTINNTTGTTTSASTGRTINVAGNWTNNGVFNATGSTVNFRDNNPQAITGTTATTFDDVTIGKTGGTLSVNTNAIIGDDLTFTASSGTLSVSSSKTLTVADRLTLNNDDDNSVSATITGSGTLTASTVIVGPSLNPDDNTRTTTLNSSISSFTIANNLEINSYYSFGDRNNGVFNLASGILAINGQIDTTNENSGNVSTFSMTTGAQSGILKLTGASPFNLSGQGTNTINLNGITSVVEYLGSVPQTALGTIYKTLKINNTNSGTGVTLGANASATTLDLTDGLVTTGANTMIILSGGSIINASANSYVNGKLNRTFTNTTSATFPVGKGGVYSPVVFTYTASPGTKTVTIEQFETGSPFSSSSISTTTFGARYWNITQSAIGTNYTVGLNNGGKTPLGSVVMLRKNNTTITLNNPTTFSSPNYTNSSAFSATVVSNDVALGETAIPLSITGVTGINNKIYDGNAIATAIGSPVLSGTILPGETVTLSGIPVYTFNNKNVGTGKSVTVSGLVLTGADAGAYSLPTNQIPGLTGNITVRPITVTALTDSKVYDGTISSSLLPTYPSLQSGDVTLTSPTQSFDTKNVGNGNKTITPIGLVINDGNGGNNYAITYTPVSTGSITKKTLTPSLTNAVVSKVYDTTTDATLTTANYSLATKVGTEDVYIATTSGTYNSANASTVLTVSVNGLTLGGVDKDNYDLSTTSISRTLIGTITKATLTASLIGTVTKVYNGNNSATLTTSNYSLVSLAGSELYGTDIWVTTTSGAYDNKSVGINKNITVTSLSLGGPKAGNYTISNGTSLTAALGSIIPKDITVSLVGSITKEYDTNNDTPLLTPANFNLSGKVSGDDLTVSNTITAGTYNNANAGNSKPVTVMNLVFSGADKNNYNVTNAASVTSNVGTITKASLTASLIGSVTKVYNGNATATLIQSNYSLSGIVSPDVYGTDVYVADTSGAYDTKNIGIDKGVTVTTLSLGGPKSGNYTISNGATVTGAVGEITPKDITVSLVGPITKEYDTNNDTPLLTPANFNFNGKVSGDDLTVSNIITGGTYNNANVGNNKPVTVTSLLLTGADTINYNVTNAASVTTNVGSITGKALTASLIGSIDKVYNGNAIATLTQSNYSLSGLVSPDSYGTDVYVTDTSGLYDDKNVGSGKNVTVTTLSLGGPKSGNYIITNSASATAAIGEITPKNITVSLVGPITKEYDTNNNTPLLTPSNFNFSGKVNGDFIDATNTSGAYNNENVGNSKPVTVTSLLFTGADTANYNVTNALSVTTNVGSITGKVLTASLIGFITKVYNGNATATLTQSNYSLSGIVSPDVYGTDVYVTDTSGAYDTKNVGVSKDVTVTTLSLGGPKSGNYTISNGATVTGAIGEITTKDLTVSLKGSVSKAYDGTDVAILSQTLNYTLTGLISGNDVTVTNTSGTYNTKDFGTGKPVTVNTIVLTGLDVSNYNFVNPTSVTGNVGTIARVVLTASLIGTVSKSYDSTTAATLTAGNYSLSGGIVGSEDVSVFKANGTYDTENVGTGKTVTVSSLSLSGVDATNYALSSSSASGALGEIIAKALTITATNQTVCQGNAISQTEFTQNGLVSGDNITSVVLGVVGSTITSSNALGTGLGNYVIGYVSGTLVTNPLPTATIAVNNATQCLNQASPVITFTGVVGTGPFTFTYNRTTVINSVTTTLSNLTSTGTVLVPTNAAGTITYTLVSVQDANTCSQAQSGSVTVTVGLCTQVRNTQCGRTLPFINTIIEADAIAGATAYRFELIRTDAPLVDIRYVVTGSTPKFTPGSSLLPAGLIYGKSYNIRVQAYIGGWLSYGNTCVITAPAEPLVLPTRLSTNFCNKILKDINTSIECDPVYLATQYGFEVSGPSEFETYTYNTPKYYFGFASAIPGVKYNTKYTIRVRAYSGGSWGAYGSSCEITTPDVPQTYLLSSNNSVSGCNVTVNSLTPSVSAYEVRYAERYMFKVTIGNDPTVVAEFERLNRGFTAAQFKEQYAPGYEYNKVYKISVQVMYNSMYPMPSGSGYGPVCSIKTPMERMTETTISDTIFNVKAYPNPFASHFSLDIESSSDAQVEMKVYDMIGRQLEVRKATVSELSVQEVGRNYPSGVYNVVVSQGDKVKSVRMVKR